MMHKPNTSDLDHGRRIIRALRVMTQLLDTHSRQLLKHRDVTIPQVMCLEELVDKGTMPVGVLARSIRLSPSTTVGIIDRLERKKMVRRIPDKSDRRSVQVAITETGHEFYNATPHLMHNKLHDVLGKLEKGEAANIAAVLDTLVELLGKSA